MLDLGDAAQLQASFERAILSSLDLSVEDVDLDRLGLAYRRVSGQLAGELDSPSASLFDDPAGRAVFGLIYAGRTFHAAGRLLSSYSPGTGAIAELGAGWGPFGLRAALADPTQPVVLVDAGSRGLAGASRLFVAFGLPPPRCLAEDLAGFRWEEPLGALAIPFVLNELPDRDDPKALRRRVERWLSMLAPDGRLYLLEPGTLRSARRLQQLRDALPSGAYVHAPCTGAGSCPLLARPTDWCHFTWAVPPSPLVRTIAEKAQRNWREQHLSFLVLGRQPVEPAGPLRVLDVRPHGKAKVVARTCSKEGLVQLTALRRDAAYEMLSALEPGSLARAAGELKGDGLRVEGRDSLVVAAPI